MGRLMDLQESAAFYRLALVTRALSPEEVFEWIDREPGPPDGERPFVERFAPVDEMTSYLRRYAEDLASWRARVIRLRTGHPLR